MKICVVTERGGGFKTAAMGCDVLMYGFGKAGVIDYAAELSGRSDKLEEIAKLSSAAKCGVLCGCVTDSRGLRRKSVAAASCGKLLGVCDMLHSFEEEEYKSGAFAGVYELCGYKVGVCIENDLRFPECISAMSLMGCNLIAAFAEDISDGMFPVIIRSYAYIYGVPVVLSAGGAAYFADITGVIAFSNRVGAVFETSVKKCFRTVRTRRRGVSPGEGADF